MVLGAVFTVSVAANRITMETMIYDIKEARVKFLINWLQERGHEVALHTSFNAYKDERMIIKEKRRLEAATGSTVKGVRQHYLRWKSPESWRVKEKAGLEYDTTLSYADQVGFRVGICYPYKPFDVKERRELDIWEVPLVVMDGTLKDYMGLDQKEAIETIIKQIGEVKDSKGLLTLLWHNTSFSENKFWVGWDLVFTQVHEYLKNENIYRTRLDQIIDDKGYFRGSLAA